MLLLYFGINFVNLSIITHIIMGNLLKQHSKIKKQQIKNTSVKVAHKARVISQKEINENRSSAYSFIL